MSAPVRTKGAWSSRSSWVASGSSAPITTRSGFRKSRTAEPSFRNSGLEQTRTRCELSASIVARTRAAVPTGTVLLVTTTFWPFITRPIVAATSSTCLTSADPSSSAGVPTAMKRSSELPDRFPYIRREPQPTLREVLTDEGSEPGLVDRDRPLVEAGDLLLINVRADHIVSRVREPGPDDEADVSCPYDGELHWTGRGGNTGQPGSSRRGGRSPGRSSTERLAADAHPEVPHDRSAPIASSTRSTASSGLTTEVSSSSSGASGVSYTERLPGNSSSPEASSE